MSNKWADELHAAFLTLVGYFHRPEPDAMMIAAAGILRSARREAIRSWFADWSAVDREMLLALLTRMLGMADQGTREHGWNAIEAEIAAKVKAPK
jgi:hypothetical protein